MPLQATMPNLCCIKYKLLGCGCFHVIIAQAMVSIPHADCHDVQAALLHDWGTLSQFSTSTQSWHVWQLCGTGAEKAVGLFSRGVARLTFDSLPTQQLCNNVVLACCVWMTVLCHVQHRMLQASWYKQADTGLPFAGTCSWLQHLWWISTSLRRAFCKKFGHQHLMQQNTVTAWGS